MLLKSDGIPSKSAQTEPEIEHLPNAACRGLRRGQKSVAPKDYRQLPEWFHEGQRRVWASKATDIVACAGTQGGKTATEAPWLLREIQRCAPLIKRQGFGTFIYAGPTLKLLGTQAIPQFRELFQEREQLGRLVEGNKIEFRFSSAGLMKVLGFSDCPVTVKFAYTKDSSNLESMTAAGGVWDEAGQKDNKQESYQAYDRRLTVARSATFGDVWETAPAWWKERYGEVEGRAATFGRRLWGTTPYEWGWFKAEVVDRAVKKVQGFEFFNWPSWRNPRVTEAQCRSMLDRGMALWRWLMMYLGEFTRPAGLIYDVFDWDRNTCEDFEVPASWPRRPGADFGSVHMAGLIVAEDSENKALYVIREYLDGNKTLKEHADGIRGGMALSPGAGGSHQEEGWREAFRRHGLPLDEPPVNDVEVQIGCVYGEFKSHSLIIFRSCVRLIGEAQLYSREIGEDGEPTEAIKEKASFHLLDALRYIVTKLRPPANPKSKTAPVNPLAWLTGA